MQYISLAYNRSTGYYFILAGRLQKLISKKQKNIIEKKVNPQN